MRIGIITDVVDGEKSGIGTDTYNLIKQLNLVDKENKYHLIHHTPTDLDIYKSNKEILVPLPSLILGKGLVWRYITLTLKLKSQDFDLVHDPFGIGPLAFQMSFKKVITIHDLTPFLFPKQYPTYSVILHKLLLPKTTRNADRIITISICSKRDIIKYLKVPENKIDVIYRASGKQFIPLGEKEVRERRRKCDLDFPFILYVGVLHPRKNIPRLIEAYHQVKKTGVAHKLVIGGKKLFKYTDIFEIIARLNLERDVVFTGYVPDEDLPGLYNAADLFVFPSLYEGFGIPPLEAMACGTPVITSNTSSLPEVVGDVEIMVDPYDVDGLAEAMYRVLTDEALRKDMSKKGVERAKLFSYEKEARETLKVYQEVAGL